MKKIEYYQFMQWDDNYNSYLPRDPVFSNKEDAQTFIKDNSYDKFEKRTLYIYDSVDEYLEIVKEETKRKALAKLTDAEKQALGLI